MVTVPLDLQGDKCEEGECEEGEDQETTSLTPSITSNFGFNESLPSAQYTQSAASNGNVGAGPVVLPELVKSASRGARVQTALQETVLVNNDRIAQQILMLHLFWVGTRSSLHLFNWDCQSWTWFLTCSGYLCWDVCRTLLMLCMAQH